MQYVFHGFEAHIGRVDGERRVSIWTEDPRACGFDSAKLVPIDLSKTPYAARVNAIDYVQTSQEIYDYVRGYSGGVLLVRRF